MQIKTLSQCKQTVLNFVIFQDEAITSRSLKLV